MAQRRMLFDAMPTAPATPATPASPMTPKGGSATYGDAPPAGAESPDTFRRRTTPVVGEPPQTSTQLQEILALLTGGQ